MANFLKRDPGGDPGNERHVSLMSVLGKLVESIVKDKIARHTEEQVLLKRNQQL